jgi:hypothetical protein
VNEKSRLHHINTQKEPDCPAILLTFARGSFDKRYNGNFRVGANPYLLAVKA